MGSRWTKQEKDLLRKLYVNPNLTREDIALKLNRTVSSICNQAFELSLKRSIRYWTKEEDERLRKLFPSIRHYDKLLAYFPNRTKSALMMRVRKLDLSHTPYGEQEPLPISVAQAAYLAGLIDCDGSISILASTHRGKTEYRPAIAIFNSNTKLIHWIISVFESPNHCKRCRKIHGNQKPIFEWKTQRVISVARILRTIIPYLVIKKERALLVLEWCEGRVPYTDYTARELEIREQVFALNKRGIK